MFGIGGLEFVIILVFILIIFGPERLPEIGKILGRGLKMFQSAKQDVETTLKTEVFRPEDAQMMRQIQRDYEQLKSSIASPEKIFQQAPVKRRVDDEKKKEMPAENAKPVEATPVSDGVAAQIAALEAQLAEIKKSTEASSVQAESATKAHDEVLAKTDLPVRETKEVPRSSADLIWDEGGSN